MPLVSLKPVLAEADQRKAACLGLVCQGWEDSRAYVAAAQDAGAPAVLSAGPGARAHMPVHIWGAMFRDLGEQARVPVVAHLDHGRTVDECRAALDAGFTSLMIDGSMLPLSENIALSAQVCRLAEATSASVEAELGEVGYEDGQPSLGTLPADVRSFLNEVPCDALAISIGNSHLQTKSHAQIDYDLLSEIENMSDCPLVLHGGSGILPGDRVKLRTQSRVRKINVGTELRQIFGSALRQTLNDNREAYDRLTILNTATIQLQTAATHLLKANWS